MRTRLEAVDASETLFANALDLLVDGIALLRRDGGIVYVNEALRLLAAPFAAWLILSGHDTASLLVFAAAGLSDGLDGFIARRWGFASDFGGKMAVPSRLTCRERPCAMPQASLRALLVPSALCRSS